MSDQQQNSSSIRTPSKASERVRNWPTWMRSVATAPIPPTTPALAERPGEQPSGRQASC